MSRAAALAIAWLATACTTGTAPATLRFSVPVGRELNEFYRQGPVAAHLVLSAGATPRLVVAFPAGNSGAGLWFDTPSTAFSWHSPVTMEPARRALPSGEVLHGIRAELIATGGPVTITQAILSSVRVLRDFEYSGAPPIEVQVSPTVSEHAVIWQRPRLDGGAGYYLSIDVLAGAIDGGGSRPITLSPGPDNALRLRVTALTGDTPLTPIADDGLLTRSDPAHTRLRHALAFLSYREKLLAGSWRFNTYFGRDTLMSLRLLAPVLQPQVMEAGLGAVLERLNLQGEVAHEEDIGEFAVLRRVRAGLAPDDTPILDYKMIDDDYMLAPVAALYLLESAVGRARAAAFLAQRTAAGETYGARLARNFRFVVAQAAPFASKPDWSRLVGLKPGMNVGNWRDSENGLGGGRYPYDVNGVFVPAALDAIARLHASGLLRHYLDAEGESEISSAASLTQVWLREAPRLFDVSLSAQTARSEVVAYARSVAVDPSPALAQIDERGVSFRAVALDATGRPVPVLNSDEAFALLFLAPSPAEVERIATTLTRPFPAGLMTTVGLVVADAAFTGAALEPLFAANRYHGAVIWSWQQATLAAGIERQLRRTDLGASARAALESARTALRAAVAQSKTLSGSELWSWSQVDGRYRVETFGQRDEDETESNAVQLWSTVYLAIP